MILGLSLALAAPQFVGSSADVRVAERAWSAAETCTGWSGRAHPVVKIERGLVRHGFRGLASADDVGMYRIELDADDPELAEVIVHEVAHAWVSEGPTALVEGRAELLADCIVHHAPGIAPLQWDDGRELPNLPDLRGWDAGDGLGPSVNPLQRTDAYVGAARLVRLAGLVLPEGALWPEEDGLDWLDLDALLAEAGSPAQPLRDLLRAPGPEMGRALSDRDHDGLPELGEKMFNTDPTRFDSDGDGWWDGAGASAGARPLPFDGTPTCTGWATPPSGGTVTLRTGGNLRGAPAPVAALRVGDRASEDGRAFAFGTQSVLVELHRVDGRVSGGLWAQVDGEGLVPDDACAQSGRAVVWAGRSDLREVVADVHAELVATLEHHDSRFGGGVSRVALSLGGHETHVEGAVIHVSTEDVRRLGPRGVAAMAVAVRRVYDTSIQRDWRDVLALSRALLDR
ncbi:MAG: hypothetical protein H6736_05885 [Alphaproteobacteria bacterium]|nr:hypothetical protein [Alphaproteobacteria bacterium]